VPDVPGIFLDEVDQDTPQGGPAIPWPGSRQLLEAALSQGPSVTAERERVTLSCQSVRSCSGVSQAAECTGKLAAGYIEGVQSNGVVATIKHFVGNEVEYERSTVFRVPSRPGAASTAPVPGWLVPRVGYLPVAHRTFVCGYQPRGRGGSDRHCLAPARLAQGAMSSIVLQNLTEPLECHL